MNNGQVRNDRRTRLMPKIFFGQLSFALLITIISLGILYYGQGYRFDFSNFRVIKTGVLYLEFLPKDAEITVNGDSDWKSSSFVQNYTPGFYSVTVSKDGYMPWILQLRIDSGSVNDHRNIVLFKASVSSQALTDQDKINVVNAPVDVLAATSSQPLVNNSYEIWYGDKLITRFSKAIQKTVWYPDLSHILYQQSDEIRVIDTNGQNDTLLVKLSDEKTTAFTTNGAGTELYYLDGNTYKIATIR